MRFVEVIADAGHIDTLRGIADQHQVTDYWWGAESEDGRRAFRMLVGDDIRQAVMDALQNVFGASEGARILVLPVDTVLPRPEEDEEEGRRRRTAATREELYSQIEKGARLDTNYLLLTVLSTVVAAIGLIEDNVAVVVGAMVIAPLLGPNIALAFGTSLGDGRLAWQALKTGMAGLLLAFSLSLGIGLAWPLDITSGEILARTDVGLDGVALALASGAAAVLSLTTGLSATLVGVMVAVALLPPTATLGMLLGAGYPALATGAGLLLAVNVVCVVLAAKLVFLAKGVKPRTWFQRQKARQSNRTAVAVWILLWLVLVAVVYVRHELVTVVN
jgi:uncharacterized hydrophobic protein (TIGR00341 family)